MKFAGGIGLVLLAAGVAFPQAATGVSSEWDVRKLLDSLNTQTQHLKPIIDQVKPESWVGKGAPSAYVGQWRSTQAQLRYLLTAGEALSRDPERLTLALEAYFRMQAMESTLGSLMEGIRKYQNPALADLAQSVVSENSVNRDRLRQYIQDLAKQKEEEFKVVDREAQRCRNALVQPPSKERKPQHP
jgi:hypothetical protein